MRFSKILAIVFSAASVVHAAAVDQRGAGLDARGCSYDSCDECYDRDQYCVYCNTGGACRIATLAAKQQNVCYEIFAATLPSSL
ncbi:hypothetical protein N7508_009889 [Penicillium antarcticum]|uniref:uncharacterized protein n=1 Tax=Penicillium antarcticum TaxID=416450 RepID=UPI00238E691B|nr:uncharacterized protein N7508_009889 [Penicillium antarcticum]KAJ5295068.1 hypothetical protein N7508_009889 [Penicillium antarcticum]